MKSLLDYSTDVEVMSQETTMIMMQLMMMEGPLEDFDENAYPTYMIIKSRLEHAGGEATEQCILFLATLTDRPGTCVMWAHTLFKMFDQEPVNMSDLCNAFPHGFPTESALQDCWDSQKNGGANRLDTETWVRVFDPPCMSPEEQEEYDRDFAIHEAKGH